MSMHRDSLNESLYSQDEFYDHEIMKKKKQIDKPLQNSIHEYPKIIDIQQIQNNGNQFNISNQSSLLQLSPSATTNQNNEGFLQQKQYLDYVIPINQSFLPHDNSFDKSFNSISSIYNDNLYKTLLIDINSVKQDIQSKMVNEDAQFSFSSFIQEEQFVLRQIDKLNMSEYSSQLQYSSTSDELSQSYSDFLSSIYNELEDDLSNTNKSIYKIKDSVSYPQQLQQYSSIKMVNEELHSQTSNIFQGSPYKLLYIGKINFKLNQNLSYSQDDQYSIYFQSQSSFSELNNSIGLDQFQHESSRYIQNSQITKSVFQINKKIRKKRLKLQTGSLILKNQSYLDSYTLNLQQGLRKFIQTYIVKQINEKCYERSNQSKHSVVFGERNKQIRKMKFSFQANHHQVVSPRAQQEVKQFIKKQIKQILCQNNI